jgi:hypothetical protein
VTDGLAACQSTPLAPLLQPTPPASLNRKLNGRSINNVSERSTFLVNGARSTGAAASRGEGDKPQ